MPVLSEILSSVKAQGSVYFCDKLAPPWQTEGRSDHPASFHYVRSGQCWIEFEGEFYLLGPGDLVFIGKGDEHTLSSYKGELSLQDYQGETHLLCGSFSFRDPIPSPLSESIPAIVIIRACEIADMPWMQKTLEHLSSEYDAQAPGAGAVINKLTEIVLVELIRIHLKKSDASNFVAALYDKQIGKALELIHTQPGKQWTLEALAESVAMSRAVFARRFKALVGQTMFQYLTSVRMRMASERLRDSNVHIADVAEQVGYISDMAFGKAFKEIFGMTPIAWRRQHREALKAPQKNTKDVGNK